MARFRPRRQHRYDRLRGEGFTGSEAQVLSEFKFKQPYIRLMRRERLEIVRGVRRLGLSRRESLVELRWQINKVYEINGWKDAYAMMRDYRQRAIDRGEYPEPPRRSHHPLSTGDPGEYERYREKVRAHRVKYKARRERRKLEAQPSTKREWIAELDRNIETATGKRREQLIQQRDNLERLM